MGKKLPVTPNSQIRAALRRLFLRSRERASAMRTGKYTCAKCGVKQSRRKGVEVFVEVHHKAEGGILNWEALFAAVREYLLCNPDQLEVLCHGCHAAEGLSEIHDEPAAPAAVDEDDPFYGL